jgi:N-acyl-D-aspartate/D-glutamate deacylase
MEGSDMYDILIRGGDLVDGTGSARRRADVGIQGDRVVAVGDLDDVAAETIDATGKVVTPGFVDVHTHYDAQVFWDGALTPSPLHGVTTALAGNCGFTIAPLSSDPADGDYLMRMLARVEGMPLESLRSGVPWNWTTTAEYFDEIEGRLGINAGFMVGHSAIRRVVMGEECITREAKPEELEAMQALLRAGLDAGALGFSSSWARTHNDAEGHMVPSRFASRDEIVELCGTLADYEGTSLEFIPMVGPKFEPWAVELMAAMSAAAQRPLNWNVLGVNAKNLKEAEGKLEAGDYAREHGGRVVALTVPMSFPVYLSFRSGFILDAMPGWEGPMGLPLDEKLKFFDDRDALAKLDEQSRSDENPLRMLANWGNMRIHAVVAPENEQYQGRMVGEIATEEGRSAWDVLTSIARADELNTSFGTVPVPDSDDDWKARIQVWRDRRALIGASDAGAHLDLLASFNYATEVLGKCVRQRKMLPLEEAINLITDTPAQLYGLHERGRITEGWKADVVVLDPNTVGSHEVRMRMDLPGGAGRLYAEADGIDHVLVNGTGIVRDGALTDARAGTLLRAGRDTRTASLV